MMLFPAGAALILSSLSGAGYGLVGMAVALRLRKHAPSRQAAWLCFVVAEIIGAMVGVGMAVWWIWYHLPDWLHQTVLWLLFSPSALILNWLPSWMVERGMSDELGELLGRILFFASGPLLTALAVWLVRKGKARNDQGRADPGGD